MSLIDEVPEHEDSSPTVLDWNKIKDGLKYKAVMFSERDSYCERNNIPVEMVPDDIYIFQVLLDKFLEFKRQQAQAAAIEAAQQMVIAQDAAVKEQLEGIHLELEE